MAQVELIMPKMGESIMEATILKWVKKEGDRVELDETVLEIATDKVDSEIPSPVEGVIAKLLHQENEVVAVGKPIALIETKADASVSPSPSVAPEAEEKPAEMPKTSNGKQPESQPVESKMPAPLTAEKSSTHIASYADSNRFYSPLVKNIARAENIPVEELENIPGSGLGGRVTKKDILEYVESRTAPVKIAHPTSTTQEKVAPVTPAAQQASPRPAASVNGDVEIIEMDRMRKLIADHMVMSKHTSPHVTSFVEADVTNLVNWREKIKKEYEAKYEQKITFTPLFIEAVVKALQDYPMVNISVDGQQIIRKKYLNIGMATALPNGNLIVPVIKNAETLNLLGITKAVNDLAGRARQNKLKPEEIQDGTFTLTNVGTFGNVMGTPIINQPQVAIMATGAIKKKPAVLETEEGDVIAVRQMMFLSLSYDHRVVDGSLGGSFLRRVADYLEGFDPSRSI